MGPGAERLTNSLGDATGRGWQRSWSNKEKIAALAPMPSARESTAMAVTKGVLSNIRAASLIFRIGIWRGVGRVNRGTNVRVGQRVRPEGWSIPVRRATL